MQRLPSAVLFDPEPFGTALRHTIANVETAADFQDLRGWPALVVETARILREAYAETLIVPLTVLKPDYQGKGMGSAVLDLVMEHARARRVPVRLRTSLANRAASLYRRVGFREVGTTNTHLLFEWSDADESSPTLRRASPPALWPRNETAQV